MQCNACVSMSISFFMRVSMYCEYMMFEPGAYMW